MALRINNSYFRVSNGVFRSVEPFISSTLPLGPIMRIAGLNAESGSFGYQDASGVSVESPEINIDSPPYYILVLSGSVSSQDTISTNFFSGNTLLAITNLLITGSTTGSFTEELITTAGAGTWTKPAGVTDVVVECWGGGGAGGGATSNPAGGAGGGGGQYSRKYIKYTSPSVGIPYSVGAGGVGTQASIVNGGDTTWATNVVIAKGGTGGTPNGVDVGGVPGGIGNQAGSVGDVVYFGTDGEPGLVLTSTPFGGTGGGAAGSTSISSGLNATTYEYGGQGGSQINGQSLAGNPGANYGGGGGGAATNVATNRAGGNGAQGVIRLIYR